MTTQEDERLAARFASVSNPLDDSDWEDVLGRAGMVVPEAATGAPAWTLRRGGRGRPRFLRLGIAAVVIAAALAIGLPLRQENQPEQATAATVAASMSRAIASVRTLSAVVQLHQEGAPSSLSSLRLSIALTASGDYLSRSRHGWAAYNASTGIERAYATGYYAGQNHTLVFVHSKLGSIRKSGAPAAPDAWPSDIQMLYPNLGAVVRSLLEARNTRVKTVTYGGRRAWHILMPIPLEWWGTQADRLDLTIDQQSGLPLHIIAMGGPLKTFEYRLSRLRVNVALPASLFAPKFPAGVRIQKETGNFRRVSLAQAQAIVGYRLLVPSSVPAGFRLGEVAVSRRPNVVVITGPNRVNPASRMVVQLVYRRGVESFAITTRLRHVRGYKDFWFDPVVAMTPAHYEHPLISGGALRGTRAELSIYSASGAPPHLWVRSPRLVVTVAGDLTRSELVAVTKSLQPH